MELEKCNYSEILIDKFTEEAARKFRDEFLDQAYNDLDKPIITYINSYGGPMDVLATMIEFWR